MKVFKIVIATVFFGMNSAYSQDLNVKDVPSVILNKFQKEYPKAFDIEWEMDGGNYNVDFEIGQKDFEIWYAPSGEIIRKKEELTKSELPKSILEKINKEYSGYKVDDIKKITEGTKVVYLVELDSFTKDWKITFDASGKVLHKVED